MSDDGIDSLVYATADEEVSSISSLNTAVVLQKEGPHGELQTDCCVTGGTLETESLLDTDTDVGIDIDEQMLLRLRIDRLEQTQSEQCALSTMILQRLTALESRQHWEAQRWRVMEANMHAQASDINAQIANISAEVANINAAANIIAQGATINVHGAMSPQPAHTQPLLPVQLRKSRNVPELPYGIPGVVPKIPEALPSTIKALLTEHQDLNLVHFQNPVNRVNWSDKLQQRFSKRQYLYGKIEEKAQLENGATQNSGGNHADRSKTTLSIAAASLDAEREKMGLTVNQFLVHLKGSDPNTKTRLHPTRI